MPFTDAAISRIWRRQLRDCHGRFDRAVGTLHRDYPRLRPADAAALCGRYFGERGADDGSADYWPRFQQLVVEQLGWPEGGMRAGGQGVAAR